MVEVEVPPWLLTIKLLVPIAVVPYLQECQVDAQGGQHYLGDGCYDVHPGASFPKVVSTPGRDGMLC